MYPRANTLGIIKKEDYILLEEQEGKHSRGTGYFYRPIGGTIELGEHSSETLIREYHEEIGVDVKIERYVTCIENIYKIDENIGHEITQIYEVAFTDPALYQEEAFTVTEGEKVTKAIWIRIEDILSGKLIVYPNGLAELLSRV